MVVFLIVGAEFVLVMLVKTRLSVLVVGDFWRRVFARIEIPSRSSKAANSLATSESSGEPGSFLVVSQDTWFSIAVDIFLLTVVCFARRGDDCCL